jgi:hypothetical protein
MDSRSLTLVNIMSEQLENSAIEIQEWKQKAVEIQDM